MTVVNVTDAVLKGAMKGPTGTADLDGTIFTGTVTYDAGTTEPPIEPPVVSEIKAPIIDWLRPSTNLTDDTLRTMNGGTASYNDPVVFGRSDYPAATVTVYLGGVSKGTATTDGGGNWNCKLPVLTNAAYVLTATVASGGKTSPVSTFTFTVAHQASTGGSTAGKITNFKSGNGQTWMIDGKEWGNTNANLSHCLKQVDEYAVRFETRQADTWTGGGYNDSGNNRSEVSMWYWEFAEGVQIDLNMTITIEPGPVNTSSFCCITQCHTITDNPPCPFTLGLDTGDEFMVTLQKPKGTSYENMYIYKSPQPIVRGRAMKLRNSIKMGPSGNGKIIVYLDDTKIVDYSGAVGANGSDYYFKFGIYRAKAPETLSAIFRNVALTGTFQPTT